jgi:hypothetical protein
MVSQSSCYSPLARIAIFSANKKYCSRDIPSYSLPLFAGGALISRDLPAYFCLVNFSQNAVP